MAATPARQRPIQPIVDRSDFLLLRQGSSRCRSGPLSVRWAKNPSGPAIAFAIGTKFGNAVKRNRLRRRIKAELGRMSDLAPLPSALLLFSAQPQACTLSPRELSDHLGRLVQRVDHECDRTPEASRV